PRPVRDSGTWLVHQRQSWRIDGRRRALRLWVRPVIALAVKLKPEIAAPKPPADYDDQRPNRTEFMNVARVRGLDITLGLAALGMAATTMAPLGALATLLMFIFLRGRLAEE